LIGDTVVSAAQGTALRILVIDDQLTTERHARA
jgi:hypothetical protein